MEYAEENLSQVLPERALTLAETRDVLEPVLKALVFLHAKSLVHDRIKPANIMAVNDQVKLSSDGILPLSESRADGKKPGAYDSPERAKGIIAPPGDVWSLGMTLAEVLTRRRPAWESSLEGEPAVPATLQQPFFDIARHCLRRDPLRRWTVSDVQSRLHRTPPATPKQTPAPQWPLAIGRYAIPVVAAVILLVVVLAGGVFRKPAPQTQPAPPVASQQPQVQPQPEAKAGKTKPRPAIQKPSAQRPSSPSLPSTPITPRPSVAASKVATGDLPQGDVLEQVLPDVPQSARDTITGRVKVTVRVHVDSSGRVAGAEFQSPGPSKYFARLAMEAAQRWKFKPKPEGGEWNVRFEFGRTSTHAFPSPAAPPV
jgi:TonB family protein